MIHAHKKCCCCIAPSTQWNCKGPKDLCLTDHDHHGIGCKDPGCVHCDIQINECRTKQDIKVALKSLLDLIDCLVANFINFEIAI